MKGFTPEACNRLTVLESGRIAGDRVLAFRFGDSDLPEEAWSRKYGFTVLANTPGIARLDTRFDPEKRRLRIALDGKVLADATIDGPGRADIAAAVERFVLESGENPLSEHPQRRPIKLIGDGIAPRYHDNERGQITLHGRASLAEVAKALNDPKLDEARFRTNVVVEGIDAWEELDWLGRKVRIGGVELEGVRLKTRCLATHANPTTGARDLQVMQTLVRAFKQQEPTFAIGLVTVGKGGEIRVGDEVELLG